MGLENLPRRLKERLGTILSAGEYEMFCDNCGLPGDVDFHTVDGIQVQLCEECYLKIRLLFGS